jgi:hypothetical protein
MTKSKNSLIISFAIFSSWLSPAFAIYNSPSKIVEARDKVNGFKFEVKNCKREEEKVICLGSVESTKGDTSLWLRADGTQLIDSDGNQVKPTYMKLGSSDPYFTSLGTAHNDLTKDVPMNFVLSFIKQPDTSNKISLLRISLMTPGGNYFAAKLRNINISQAKN